MFVALVNITNHHIRWRSTWTAPTSLAGLLRRVASPIEPEQGPHGLATLPMDHPQGPSPRLDLPTLYIDNNTRRHRQLHCHHVCISLDRAILIVSKDLIT